MDISIERYFRDEEEDGLRTFCSYGKIGIHHIKSNRKTMPSFDRIITSSKYIFVEIGDKWGILDKELSFILPTSFKEIIPVKKVETGAFISTYLTCESSTDEISKADSTRPTHIAVQTVQEKHRNRPSFISPLAYIDDDDDFEDECKATIFEIIRDYKSMSDTFVLVSDNVIQLVNLREHNIEKQTGSVGMFAMKFYQLWHYRENMFVYRNDDDTYGFVSYRGGRFFCEVPYSSTIIFYKNGFISIRLGNKRNEKHVDHAILSEISKSSGKWALFKFGHRKTLRSWEETEIACLHQLTPFAFTKALEQIHDGNEFICREIGKEWVVKFEQFQNSSEALGYIPDDNSEKASSLINEYTESTHNPTLFDDYINLCFTGALKVSSEFYNEIEVREDGMFNIWTDNGCGLYDENMKVIIPARYDYPIEQIAQFMIVSKNGKYGVINDDAEEIVPCVYTSIKIGTDRIRVWDYSSEYDDFSGDWKSQTYIGNLCDIPSNHEEKMGDCFIVGINAEIKESKGIFSNLLNLRQIPNYYLNRKVAGSLCDIYLSTGEMITHFSRIPQGGIEYSKEYEIVTLFERIAYSQGGDEYLEGIQLYFIKEQKSTPKYAQIKMLNKRAFLAFDYCHVGIASNESDDKTNFPWVVPAIYFKISFPINNVIYAWKRKDNKTIIDIYDLTQNYELVSSMEYIDGSLPLVNIETKEDQSARLINLDEIDNIKYFPYEEYQESDAYDSSSGDSYENDLRDAFEDDPEAMWGRLD